MVGDILEKQQDELQLVIFDMDGLLVDTEHVYNDGWLYALNYFDVLIPNDLVKKWASYGLPQINDELIRYTGSHAITQLIIETREKYFLNQLYAGKVDIKPYARNILIETRKKFYVGLASSTLKKRGIEILEVLDLLKYIDCPVFGDEVKNLKPEPDVYLKVLAKTGINPINAIAVEDSITGTIAAEKAHLATILVPDSSFPELIKEIPKNVVNVGKDLSILFEVYEKM